MILRIIRYFVAFVISALAMSQASVMAQSPPKPLVQGIANYEVLDGSYAVINETLHGKETLFTTSELPFDSIKGKRNGGEIRGLECSNIQSRIRCVVVAIIENQEEFWLIERNISGGEWDVLKLPYNKWPAREFFSDASSNFSTNSLISYLSLSSDQKNIHLVVKKDVTNTIAENPEFEFFNFENYEYAALRPVQSSMQLQAMAAVLPRVQILPLLQDSTSVIIYTRADGFRRIALPEDCFLLGGLNDKIMCVSKSRQPQRDIHLGGGISIVYISPPEHGEFDVVRQAAAASHVTAGRWAFLTALDAGVARPVIWDSATGKSHWLDLSDIKDCIDNNQDSNHQRHIQVVGVTSAQDGLLIHSFSAVEPSRLFIVPFTNGAFDNCALDNGVKGGRELYTQMRYFDPLITSNERFSKKAEEVGENIFLPPFNLIKSKVRGPLDGKLLIMSYGVHGFVNSENYLAAWGKYWLGRGGSIAIAHLPGGGGYGAEWRNKGLGIRGKIVAAKSLDGLRKHLQSRGIGSAGTSLLTESAGGPIAAYAASIESKAYDAVILRAGCLELSLSKRENCTRRAQAYGDVKIEADRDIIAQYNKIDAFTNSPTAPYFIFGIPEIDTIIDRDYQLRAAGRFAPDRRKIINLPGVNHTERLDAAGEERWVKAVVDAVIAESNRKAAGRLALP